jgi:type I restriction-modification system DNA methylase subunit
MAMQQTLPIGAHILEQSGLADKAAAYSGYYRTLAELKEEFHRAGRYDDANIKLDEIVKLLLIRHHESQRVVDGLADRFNVSYLEDLGKIKFGSKDRIASALRALSEEVLNSSMFQNPDGTSMFGNNASLNIQPSDNEFARHLIECVKNLLPECREKRAALIEHFDVFNESFGVFVRDTFRNTKEDAQYMTPAEVVSAMTDMVFADIERDADETARIVEQTAKKPYIIVDPTCGVGSFLVLAARQVLKLAHKQGIGEAGFQKLTEVIKEYCVHGQDKVDRMVRLAKANMVLSGTHGAKIAQGNSISGKSSLSELRGKVDLILTNPPFGAEHNVEDLLTGNREDYPILGQMNADGRLGKRVSSELVLLDRCVSLLKPGGRLVIVLPDNVISAKGVEATFREILCKLVQVKAVVELPGVTFAQAGTRTKTCFLYIQKVAPQSKDVTFMGVCNDIGFDVVMRVGSPVKLQRGSNELIEIVDTYVKSYEKAIKKKAAFWVAGEEPSSVWVRTDSLINGRLTPNFYHFKRLNALAHLESLRESGFELLPLASLASLCSRDRRRVPLKEGAKTISILHISAEGTINFREVNHYSPKTLGIKCMPGDVLFSKINPRIPRVAVVPVLNYEISCSSEFEILRPKKDVKAHLLAALLLSRPVQEQIHCLTSGTSSSHNRIKDIELADILIPFPNQKGATYKNFSKIAIALSHAAEKRYEADTLLMEQLERLDRLICASAVAVG